MSLKCAIDKFVFGHKPLYDNYADCSTSDWLYNRKLELTEQVAFVHSQGKKFWAMLASDDDIPNDSLDINNQCCTIRAPSPSEVKLAAWLAVACDADGILWYPFGIASSLIAWAPDQADTCGNPNGLQYHAIDSVWRTDRYYAAKKVCNSIQQLAPFLDSPDFEFVKTYASRAFEHSYSYAGYAATQTDTLATNCEWYGQSYRAVFGIDAWAPDTAQAGEWLEEQDTNPYVQVARFRNVAIALHDPAVEDYWFLIVNRRALPDEQRKIRLSLEIDSSFQNYPYFANYILGDSTSLTSYDPASRDTVHDIAIRFLDVILEPGEAELVHFYRGQLGCDETRAHIDSLTLARENQNIRLRWEEITYCEIGYDSGNAFEEVNYTIYGSDDYEGDYTPIGFTTTTTYVDSLFCRVYPHYYYEVQACGRFPWE